MRRRRIRSSLGCRPPASAAGEGALGDPPAPGSAARRAAAVAPGQRPDRHADPGSRHELRRPAQRRYAPLPDRPVRRARGRRFAGHRVDRAPVMARMGCRRALAAARRRNTAAFFAAGLVGRSIRWRANCARCCASSIRAAAVATRARPGARKCCAASCTSSCWATRCSSCRIASRSSTTAKATRSRCCGRPAAWSPRSSR